MTLKILLSTLTLISSLSTADFAYENRVQMDENYMLQWSVKAPDIVFEMQVKTHGYMGFGLSRDGTVYGADIFISWMDDGHIFFYVSLFLWLKNEGRCVIFGRPERNFSFKIIFKKIKN